ncbi:MAG: Gfo/Idh/MocA family oxidoreductase [Planctomycetes bacterium]|nr:Gfo/Idh/MocA family oxidoreductase [Planctomycetota bacterium]
MHFLDRREFMQQSAGLAGVIGSGFFLSETEANDRPQAQATPRGANERINVAVIGVRSRGRDHITGLAGRHNCVVTHVCDVDTAVVGGAVELARQRQGSAPTVVQDLRRIMENRDIHAVSIATPNHWHALAGIWAMQNGKHVYVEKPVSHNVWEGRRLVEASRHYDKICQAGTQIRSEPNIREAIEFLRSGGLGRCSVARGLCYKRRNTIGRVNGPQQAPRTMDYNLWCGPASNAAPRRNNPAFGPVHYDWHWIWEYGNGDLGNQGIHQMDVARWGLGKSELSRSVMSLGGRFGYVDDGETPNTQVGLFDYGDCELIFEVRGLFPMGDYRTAQVGNVFHCANGYLVMTNYSTATAFDNNNNVVRRFNSNRRGDHYGNFVAAIRSGRRQDLQGEILEGHISSALCHIVNVSHRLGRTVAFSRRDGILGEHREGNETLNRMIDHLRAREVNLDQAMLTVGRRLTLDVRAETFGNDAEANRLLTREYREGFVVPARF